MTKKKKKKKKTIKLWESSPNLINLKKQLAFLKVITRKIQEDKVLYFDEQQNLADIQHYYQPISHHSKISLFFIYHDLLEKTHKNQIPYFFSKDLYLYTWVDLYPDASVKSIYSGEKKDPESLIIQDYQMIRKRYDEYESYLQKVTQNEFESLKELKMIEWKYKLSTEHIVPKSWFSGLEPMKGDLHHLFICEPECNIARSNFPYEDFSSYNPELEEEYIHNQCGLAIDARFEPEHGKVKAARAMMYFLLRYPRTIKKTYRLEIDIPMLIRWHQEFPVSLHEKHRNQAIYHIQGNRNPFIDFPDLTDEIHFPTI